MILKSSQVMHGAWYNTKEFKAYQQMLIDVWNRTKQAIANGSSVEDFIASQATADYDEQWGGGLPKPEQFLTIVYQSLSQ